MDMFNSPVKGIDQVADYYKYTCIYNILTIYNGNAMCMPQHFRKAYLFVLINACVAISECHHWELYPAYLYILSALIPALLKQVDCFNHRVVALVADKLERQWLED